MTSIDHLQCLVRILEKTIAELPAGQRSLPSELAREHVIALGQALQPQQTQPAPTPADGA